LSDDKELEKQIREAAQLTILANKISEVQEKNMKMLPLIFFNGVKRVQIDYDLHVDRSEEAFKNPHKHFVTYRMAVDETEENNRMDFRCEHLERGIWNLFWPKIKVQIYFNDKLVFESKENGKETT
jgi:hypothetical protein